MPAKTPPIALAPRAFELLEGPLGGDIRFEMTGNWAVADGSVTHSDIKMEALSDNALAKFMSGLINSAQRDLGGTADIRELGDDRIVMLGDDGAAMRYDRVR